MNKQEAIGRIKSMDTVSIYNTTVNQRLDMLIKTLDIISQIDELQKPVVPKFVAEWIEYCKANNIKLLGALDPDAKPWEFGMEILVNSFDGNVGDCYKFTCSVKRKYIQEVLWLSKKTKIELKN